MPPIFGILNTSLKQPDPALVLGIQSAANYEVSREVKSFNMKGGFVATAIVKKNATPSEPVSLIISGDWSVIADVSLFKRNELISRLGVQGNISELNDAHLILEAFLKWGKACVRYLYGDFAFVIFNTKTGEAFCGRDPIGVRPLFYYKAEQTFIFGSELRYVLAALSEKPAMRKEYLIDTLITAKTKNALTPFENIYRLMPGSYLHTSKGETITSAFWEPDLHQTLNFKNEDDYIQLFRATLIEAVTMRCNYADSVAAELSGGIDSSAVTGIAAMALGSKSLPLAAFSNVLPSLANEQVTDEREFIYAMLAHTPLLWTGIDRNFKSLPELLNHSLEIQGCFIQQNFSIFNNALYDAAGKRGFRILLSGFGGDELVSRRISVPWFELIDRHDWKTIYQEITAHELCYRAFLRQPFILTRYLISKLQTQKEYKVRFNKELLNERFKVLPLNEDFSDFNKLKSLYVNKSRKPYHKYSSERQFANITGEYVPQRIEYCYTAAAQYGLEYRYPLLDTDLVEAYLAFPPHMKLHQGVTRYVFRQAVKDIIPEKIRKRNTKTGMTIPHSQSMLRDKETIDDILNGSAGSEYLKNIFSFSKFQNWHSKLVGSDLAGMNYLMPGAFYHYLMILLYFKNVK
jgi:asparagine synthase (glutamine-hydrolysing)